MSKRELPARVVAVLELRKGSRAQPVDTKRKGRTAERREWRRREGLSRGGRSR